MSLFIDTETFSVLDLRQVGGYKYSLTCEVLLVSYAIADDAVQCWDVTLGEPMPRDLKSALLDEGCEVVMHNSNFDRNVISNFFEIDINLGRIVDTMILASSAGLPASLSEVGKALKLKAEHQKHDGNKLINLFCKPAPDNRKVNRYTRDNKPAEWEAFIRYAINDIHAMRQLYYKIPHHNIKGTEKDLWMLDQKINDRGIPIDTNLVEAALELVTTQQTKLDDKMREVSGGEIDSTSAVQQIKNYLLKRGYAVASLDQAYVLAMLTEELPEEVREVLELRRQAGRTSTSKYVKIRDTVSVDGRLRGCLQFYGARTGRWSGRNLQPQNLPRGSVRSDVGAAAILNGVAHELYDDVLELASSCVRSVICAGEGKQLIVADLANIEGRVLAWLAGEEWKLQAFRDYDAGAGPDLYKLAYAKSFDMPPEEVTKAQRQVGKVMELALGYQGGAGAFGVMAKGYGVDLEEEAIAEIIQSWRKAHPRTRAFWYQTQTLVEQAIRSPEQSYRYRGIVACVYGEQLYIKLPSGRYIIYQKPGFKNKELHFYGLGFSRKFEKILTYGGKLVENITQAVARDIIAYPMPLIEEAGYTIVLTVHDELVCEVDQGAGLTKEGLCSLMTAPMPWTEGLPLAAEGYTAERYRK